MADFYQLEFERPLRDIERQMEVISQRLAHPAGAVAGPTSGYNPDDEQPEPSERFDPVQDAATLESLQAQHRDLLRKIYSELNPWDIVRIARHPRRPQSRDYIERICKDFCELHGDRRYGDDPAIICGFARIGSTKCMVVGHQKGRTTQEKLACHFGCAHPEGYRKALAKMQLAAKYNLPIVTFVDTPGAYPGVGAEERGQAEAIAVNMLEMSRLETPIISIVIGEGGSGGALGIAVADRVAMLEFSWYSVISPEGCAAILWKQANEQTNTAAARSLRLTATDNMELGIVDDVIREPIGGAHRDHIAAAHALERWIVDRVDELKRHKPHSLPARRYERFRKIGRFQETAPSDAEKAGATSI